MKYSSVQMKLKLLIMITQYIQKKKDFEILRSTLEDGVNQILNWFRVNEVNSYKHVYVY